MVFKYVFSIPYLESLPFSREITAWVVCVCVGGGGQRTKQKSTKVTSTDVDSVFTPGGNLIATQMLAGKMCTVEFCHSIIVHFKSTNFSPWKPTVSHTSK